MDFTSININKRFREKEGKKGPPRQRQGRNNQTRVCRGPEASSWGKGGRGGWQAGLLTSQSQEPERPGNR